MYRNGFSKTLLVLLASFLLAACATEAGYKKICESWMGAPCDKLARQWGPPQDIMRLDDGSRLYVYRNSAYVNFGYGWQTAWCETQFECSTEGRIVDWHLKGNNCKGKYKEDPKPKTVPEQKTKLGEGNEIFRRDVVSAVMGYYNSHGLSYNEETLVSAIETAENYVELERKGMTEKYLEWFEKQPEYSPELAEYNYLLMECARREFKRQQEKEQR